MPDASRLKLCRNVSCGEIPSKTLKDSESNTLSLTTDGSSTNAALGLDSAGGLGTPPFEVTHKGAGPCTFVAVQSWGSAGGVTLSKFWLSVTGRQQNGQGEGAGAGVGVTLGVGLGVGVIGGVGVGVGVPKKWHQTTLIVSTRQPSLEPLLSLAILQRSTPFQSSDGRFTIVVVNPPELPVQAWRPAMGLPVSVAIVPL